MEKETSKQKNLDLQRQFSAGGIVFKKSIKEGTLWLITKSSPNKEYPKPFWRLQKGWLDDLDGGKLPGPLATGKVKAKEEDLKKAAVREVEEEGGVKARVTEKVGNEKYFYTTKKGERILKFVTFYLMEYLKNLPEGPGFETSEISWLPYEDARRKLTYSTEKKMLDKAKILLDSGIQTSLV